MPAADTYPERKCIIMPFTPISHAEYDRVKSAKKQAFLWLADNFFTVYFAFILCFLPCLFIAVIWRGTSFFLTAEVFFGFLTVFSFFLACRGFKAFVCGFYRTGKRCFMLIPQAAFARPVYFLTNTVLRIFLCLLPSVIIYFIPYTFHADMMFSLVCEVLSICFGAAGICLAAAHAAFGCIRPQYLRFTSMFAFQLFLCFPTKGLWLAVLIPHFTLSSIIYSNTTNKEYPK